MHKKVDVYASDKLIFTRNKKGLGNMGDPPGAETINRKQAVQ